MRGGVRREEVSKFFPVSSGKEQAESAALTSRCKEIAHHAIIGLYDVGQQVLSVTLLSTGYCSRALRNWRRGELNPCPRRYPRKPLHV